MKDGILQPILVRPREDRYEIVEGWHRYEAALEAGLDEIPALIKDMSDHEVLVSQLKLNSIRPVTHSFEYARRLKILMEEGLTIGELSVMIDKSQSWIRDQIQLNRLCEDARPHVEAGEIKMASALALANLPSDLQPKFLQDAVVMEQSEFVERAKSAKRDFQAFLLRQRQEKREQKADLKPILRDLNVLKRESLYMINASRVLKSTRAKTASDGWLACLRWVFKLDPDSVKKRQAGKEEQDSDDLRRATNEEYRKINNDMIEKFVLSSRSGDSK